MGGDCGAVSGAGGVTVEDGQCRNFVLLRAGAFRFAERYACPFERWTPSSSLRMSPMITGARLRSKALESTSAKQKADAFSSIKCYG